MIRKVKKANLSKTVCVLTILLLLCILTVGCAEKITRGDSVTTDAGTIGSGSQDASDSATGRLDITTTAQNGSLGDDPFRDSTALLTARILKTGKSDCTLITAPDAVILIDTADTDDYELIDSTLQAQGVTAIDCMILTHFDNDHIGSAGAIIRNYQVKNLYIPAYTRVSENYRAMLAAVQATDTPVQIVTEDVTFSVGSVSLVLNPTHLYDDIQPVTIDKDDGSTDAEENNFSLITALTYGTQKLLFLGDAEKERLAEFNKSALAKDTYALLKLPHHGDNNGQLRKLLGNTKPSYCISCVASSHNMDVTLTDAVRLYGAWHYATYDGTVIFRTDGTQVRIAQEN